MSLSRCIFPTGIFFDFLLFLSCVKEEVRNCKIVDANIIPLRNKCNRLKCFFDAFKFLFSSRTGARTCYSLPLTCIFQCRMSTAVNINVIVKIKVCGGLYGEKRRRVDLVVDWISRIALGFTTFFVRIIIAL